MKEIPHHPITHCACPWNKVTWIGQTRGVDISGWLRQKGLVPTQVGFVLVLVKLPAPKSRSNWTGWRDVSNGRKGTGLTRYSLGGGSTGTYGQSRARNAKKGDKKEKNKYSPLRQLPLQKHCGIVVR